VLCDDGAVGVADDRYYGPDLALVHHRGFGFHASACAPSILALLEPVLAFGNEALPEGLRVFSGEREP